MADRDWTAHARIFLLGLRALDSQGYDQWRLTARAERMLSVGQKAQNFAPALVLQDVMLYRSHSWMVRVNERSLKSANPP